MEINPALLYGFGNPAGLQGNRSGLYFLQTHLKFMVISVILGIQKIKILAVIKNIC